jgi:DNA-binding LacI/PurR family transcriptional regulator
MIASSREKNVTQSDIAKALGVSQASVGLVLGRNSNGRGRNKLRSETVLRIEEKAREMGYRPHRFAQALRQGRTMTVGMIHAGSLLQVSNERAYHSTRALKQGGYQILAMDINHQASVEEIVQQFLDARVDGVLLASTMVEGHIAPLFENEIPTVGLSSDDIPGIPQVRCDMGDGIRQLVQHLLEKGCRRLVQVIMSSEPHSSSEWRWQAASQAQGFRDGISHVGGKWAEASLEGYSNWLANSKTSTGVSGLALVSGVLNRRAFNPYLPALELAPRLASPGQDHPDAILCLNDDWAFGLCNGLLRSGISLPRDIAITGFNDSALAETFFMPLTTVRQPTREMAELAVKLLLEAMNGNPPEPVVHSLKGELIPRDSTLLSRPSPPSIDGFILN